MARRRKKNSKELDLIIKFIIFLYIGIFILGIKMVILFINGLWGLVKYICKIIFKPSKKNSETIRGSSQIVSVQANLSTKEIYIKDSLKRYRGKYYKLRETRDIELIYQNADGEINNRLVTINGVFLKRDRQEYGHQFIMGFCHLRKEYRMFKATRILKLVDRETGEVIEKLGDCNQWMMDTIGSLIENESAKKYWQKKMKFFVELEQDRLLTKI